MSGRESGRSKAVVEESRAVLTGWEAMARLERAIAPSAVARDPAVAEGLALAGFRAASLSRGLRVEASGSFPSLRASCVHHVEAQPGQVSGGAFEFAASSVQQAVDQSVAAHLLSGRLGRAGLCSLAPSLSGDLTLASLPERGRIADLLQTDGGPPELEAGPERVVELAAEILHTVGESTGRPSQLIETLGDPGAKLVLVASGAAVAPARQAARALSEAGLSATVLSVTLVRPFPEARVREALAQARMVLVVQASGAASALLEGVQAAAREKVEVRTLPGRDPGRWVERLAELVPERSLELPPWLEPEVLGRRLLVVPAGPWGEATLREGLAALGSLVPLELERRLQNHLGATAIRWDSPELPENGGDLLLASHPAALEAQGALSSLEPHSPVVVLCDASSPRELGERLTPKVRELVRERELRLHWLRPPGKAGEAPPEDELDRAACLALAGAAVVLACGREQAAAAALPAGDGDAQRWLREGAEGLNRLEVADLDPALYVEEVDFRPGSELPRLPEPVDDPKQRARWASWIRRFHHRGSAGFDAAPVATRPIVLDLLADTLRSTPRHPFVLLPREDPERPLAARTLRELLVEEVEALAAAGREARTLADNLDGFVRVAARLVRESETGSELGGILSAAGKKLAQELGLPESEQVRFAEDLKELIDRQPAGARVLDMRRETPLRLYLEVLEAVRAPLRRRFAAQLGQLRERLRDLLQLDRMSSAKGRTPEAVAAELGFTAAAHLDPAALARTLPEGASSATLSPARRRRIAQALATIQQHLEHQDQPPFFFLRPPELTLPLPEAVQQEHPDPLAAAVGYFDGTARRMAPLFRAVRTARLEVQGRYRPERDDAALAELDWEGFTAEELALVPPVAVVTSGQRLRQRDQGSLSTLLSSSRPVHGIVLDEVGAPDKAEDLSLFHVDLGYLVMAHREAFAVSSTLSRPERLTEGLVRMVRAPRPGVALVHLPAEPLAPWHGLLAEAALHGRACPDFLYDPDAGPSWANRFDLAGNPEPERPWPLERIAYFEADEERSLEAAFTFADAVALEPAYRRHLRSVPRVAWDDDVQVPLAEYLENFDPEGRGRSIPFLWVVDAAGELQRAIVTRELAVACRDRLRSWRVLQELAGYENAYAEQAAAAARERTLVEAAGERDALEQAHAEALSQARAEGAHESMARLAARLMSPEGILAASSAAPAPVTPAVGPLAPSPETAAEPVPEEPTPEEEAPLAFEEPYIDSPLCTTCNECTNLNSRLFQYNAEKQAFIADATAGTFAELVKAAELCPARCIHPGKPRNGDATATPELIARANVFN